MELWSVEKDFSRTSVSVDSIELEASAVFEDELPAEAEPPKQELGHPSLIENSQRGPTAIRFREKRAVHLKHSQRVSLQDSGSKIVATVDGRQRASPAGQPAGGLETDRRVVGVGDPTPDGPRSHFQHMYLPGTSGVGDVLNVLFDGQLGRKTGSFHGGSCCFGLLSARQGLHADAIATVAVVRCRSETGALQALERHICPRLGGERAGGGPGE